MGDRAALADHQEEEDLVGREEGMEERRVEGMRRRMDKEEGEEGLWRHRRRGVRRGLLGGQMIGRGGSWE